MRTEWTWIRLLTRAMHDLIIRPPDDLPVVRLCRMWREQITSIVSFSAILFPIDYIWTKVLIFLEVAY